MRKTCVAKPRPDGGTDQNQFQKEGFAAYLAARAQGLHYQVIAPCGAGKTQHIKEILSYDVMKSKAPRKALVLIPQMNIVPGWCELREDILRPRRHAGISWWPSEERNYTSDDYTSQKMTALGKFLLTPAVDFSSLDRSTKTIHESVGFACNASAVRLWNSEEVTDKMRMQMLRGLTLVIDENHHALTNSAFDEVKIANQLGKMLEFVFASQHKFAPADRPRLIFSTATNYRGDRLRILSSEAEQLFARHELLWHEFFPTLGIDEFTIGYWDYKGFSSLCELLIRNIQKEPKEHHMVVVAGEGDNYCKDHPERKQLLVNSLLKAFPGRIVLDLVTPSKQKLNKARLFASPSKGREFDIILTCRMVREGADLPALSRIHHTTPEGSLSLALQTMGRLTRRDDETSKKKISMQYYLPELSKALKKIDLSTHTNTIIAGMVIGELLSPVVADKAIAKAKRRGKRTVDVGATVRRLGGEEKYRELMKEILEEVEILPDDVKTPEAIRDIIDKKVDKHCNKKLSTQDRASVIASVRRRLATLCMLLLPQEIYDAVRGLAEKEEFFNSVVGPLCRKPWSFFQSGTIDAARMRLTRSALCKSLGYDPERDYAILLRHARALERAKPI